MAHNLIEIIDTLNLDLESNKEIERNFNGKQMNFNVYSLYVQYKKVQWHC